MNLKRTRHVLASLVPPVLALLALALATGTALASHSPGNSDGPPQDFVTGAGKHAGGQQFTLSAHSGPAGEDPKGKISFKTEDGRVHAEVTCLIVSGNVATVTAIGTSPGSEGDIIVAQAVDNGEPSDANPDLLRFSFLANQGVEPDPVNPGCFVPIFPPVPVEQGNIVVHDGQPG